MSESTHSEQSNLNADDLATFSAGATFNPNLSKSFRKTTFQTGDLVANRYKVIRFLAQGGMGEVYEAEDLELKELIALKTIRPEIAEDERTIERFKREIHLARRVTHPNVCRIFEFGVHRQVDGPGILFLTMELLQGETLSAYMRREGRLTSEQVLPLARQLSEGLEAAHKAGIIHRDFKGANVLLVKNTDGSQRAVITDFGLARSEIGSVQISQTRAMVGTPAYMAPEQVRAEKVSLAVDIYALGVVLYEMLTGSLPFEGEAHAVMYKRLHEDPTPPRHHVNNLDSRWERTILRCLERDPQDRFSRTTEVIQALEGAYVPLSRRQKRYRKKLAFVASFLVFLATSGWVGYVRWAETFLPPRTMAFLGFKNLSGAPEANYISLALSEELSSHLSATKQLRLLPGESISRMKQELALSDADSYSKETLAKIKENLGADLVVLGSYLAVLDGSETPIGLNVRLQDTNTGQLIAGFHTESANLSDLTRLAEEQIKKALNLSSGSEPKETFAVLGGLLAKPEASRAYYEGLKHLRQAEPSQAEKMFRQAVDLEPENPILQSALAESLEKLGFSKEAGEIARKAFESSAKLPLAERIEMEARFREAISEWKTACEKWSLLFQYYPEKLEYGLKLASAQIQASVPSEALSTLNRLRKLGPSKDQELRIDLLEVHAHGAKTDFKKQKEVAHALIEKARKQHASLIVAETQLASWRALISVQDGQAALDACIEAQKTFEQMRNRSGVGRALEGQGYILRWMEPLKDLKRSEELYLKAIEISTKAEDFRVLGLSLRGLGLVYHEQGLSLEAKQKFQESLEIFRKISNTSGEAWARTSIGYELYAEGNFEEAESEFSAAVAAFLGIEELESAANALRWLGMLKTAQKQYDKARDFFQQAADLSLKTDNYSQVLTTFYSITELYVEQAKFQEALDWLKQQKPLLEKRVLASMMGEFDAIQGYVLCHDCQLQAAEPIFKKAMAITDKPESPIRLHYSWLLFMQDKPDEAMQQLQLAEKEYKKFIPGILNQKLLFGQPIDADALDKIQEFTQKMNTSEKEMDLALGLEILALAQLRLGNPEQALEAAERHLKMKEKGAMVSSWPQAMALIELGRFVEAKRALEYELAKAESEGRCFLKMLVQLSLGQLEWKQEGKKTILENLQKEAQEKGALYFSRKAAEALAL